MSIIRVLISFFHQGKNDAFERHRSRLTIDVDKHNNLASFKKHLIEFTGLNELSKAHGITSFELKLFRLCRGKTGKPENLHIATNHQWLMEYPLLISDDLSELNGEFNSIVLKPLNVNMTLMFVLIIRSYKL